MQVIGRVVRFAFDALLEEGNGKSREIAFQVDESKRVEDGGRLGQTALRGLRQLSA